MYLKQLELENFKSFGKKMSIPLLEGYTAVTGPNGSGKSNISDAILFVLGPKSSRAIRAGKLTDLIFNGGKSKQPASYTKVSLLFDNSDRMIPVESDTVKLTRLVKLSESGDGYNSYFYVNDRKSSLTEFDTLLSNARISADGYNFVQQGDVTKIVEMSNLERRRILDDISGMTKFDEEILKAEAERKEAEENIDRISIIITELEKQIEQLDGERVSALKYLETKDRLDLSKAQMAYKRKESAESEIGAINKQIEQYAKEVESLKAKKEEITSKIQEVEGKVLEVEKETEERGGQEFKELKEKIDYAKIEIARAQDQAARAFENATEIEGTLEGKAEEKKSLTEEIESLSKKLKESEEVYLGKLRSLEGKKKELEEVHGKVSKHDEELGKLEEKISDMDKTIDEKEEKLHELTLEKERTEDKRDRLKTDISTLEETKKSLEFEVNDADWNIKELKNADKGSSKELREIQEQFHCKKNLEGKLGHQAEELEDAIRRLTREYNSLKAEQEAAESIAKGYTRAVRVILEARDKRGIKGIHGTIAELAEVDPKYEVALNVAAGSRMQSIVVDSDEVAATAIKFLKDNSLGRATFLPLNKMLDGKPRGKAILAEKQALGYAIDLIKFDQKFRAAFWYVFGDTVVVETLDQARKLMGGVRLVTIGGELLEASGAMVGGTVEASQLKFGNAAKGKLEELADQLRKATEESEKVSEQLKTIRAELVALENRIRELSGTESTKDVRLGALESRKQEVRTRLTKALEELKAKGEELRKVEEGLKSLSQGIETLSKEIEQMKEQRELDKKMMSELAPHDLSQRLKTLQSEIVELSSFVSELKSERETAQSQADLAMKRLSDVDALEKDAHDKICKLKKEAKEASAKESKMKVELSGLKKIEESMGKEINELREKRDSLFKNKVALEGEKDKVQSKMETASDFSVGLTTKLSVAEDKLRELEAEMKQYNAEIKPPLPSLEALKDTISSCESALVSMGAVNLKAIDDYGQKKSRYDELKSETQRLEAQKKDLLKLMGELNEKKKVGLFKVYDAVNENFKRAYFELSGGGEAELILENSESPFEGGLVIKAKPKNGKVLRLEALSGGEKSLTALAFVFAIQEHQPSPFYLLDEIDMFLDAINADMVAHRIQRASQTAQFVQISLRKVTLNKADHIIGVTKQEGGVSSVIMKPNIGEINDFQEELKVPNEKAAEGAS